MTQNNLGNVLLSLGERESGTEHLNEAVSAYREALKERTHEKVPIDWATTQNNLGNALVRLGERENGTEHLNEAISAFKVSLEVFKSSESNYYLQISKSGLQSAETLLHERMKIK